VLGSVIQSPAGTLIFGNASGTVTVSNGVNAAAGMIFSTDGYSVTNSTITLTGATAASKQSQQPRPSAQRAVPYWLAPTA
jgi:hypothetical protein